MKETGSFSRKGHESPSLSMGHKVDVDLYFLFYHGETQTLSKIENIKRIYPFFERGLAEDPKLLLKIAPSLRTFHFSKGWRRELIGRSLFLDWLS